MPRLMSVSLTETQVRARTKTVTRRAGWLMLRPGDRLTLCRKVMGRRKGEPLERITDVEVISVRREPLNRITAADVAAEGFPDWTPGRSWSSSAAATRAAPRTPTSPVSSGATLTRQYERNWRTTVRDFTKWPRLIVRQARHPRAGQRDPDPHQRLPLPHQRQGLGTSRRPAARLAVHHPQDRRWSRLGRPGLAGSHGILQGARRSGPPLPAQQPDRVLAGGGPKGWCDWEGNIACRNYNIGKWPTAEEVTEDWLAIAAAFPYLELRAQVITDEGEGEIAAEWAVREGDAALVEPIGLLEPPEDILADEGAFVAQFFSAGRERGVTLARLAEALAQVRGPGA